MSPREIVHAYHRFWRYRLRSERDELAYLFQQRIAGSTVIDIGANRGVYSYWMHRHVGMKGCVVAFEPQPELVTYLEGLKRSLRLQRLTVVAAALSDQPGKLCLVRPRSHWGGASFHLESSGADCESFFVPVTTLDDYIEKHDLRNVSFIKCDVQDHELQALRGAIHLLASQKPTILVEQTDGLYSEGGLRDLLTSLGYEGFFFYRRELVSINDWASLRPRIKAPFLNYVYKSPSGRK